MFNKTRIAIAMSTMVMILSITAFGSVATKQISATFRDIKVKVSGEEITTEDADGVEVEPFIVNGRVYLPIRAVSEALERDVHWNPLTNTVSIRAAKPMVIPGYKIESITGAAIGLKK